MLTDGEKIIPHISGAASLLFGGILATDRRTARYILWTLSSGLGEVRGMFEMT